MQKNENYHRLGSEPNFAKTQNPSDQNSKISFKNLLSFSLMASIAQPEVRDGSQSQQASRLVLAGDSLASGILFAMLLTVGQRAIGFLRGTLFCRWMTDQELGQWSMVWGFLMLLPPLAMLGLPGCFGKYTEFYRHRGCARRFIWQVSLVCSVTSLLGTLVLLAWPEWFSKIFFRDPNQGSLVMAIGITILAVGFSNYITSLLESLRQVRLVTWIRFLTAISFALLGSLAILVFEHSVYWVTLSFAACSLIGLFPLVWIWWRRDYYPILELDSKSSGENIWKRILPFAGWLWSSNLLNNSIEIADRYMLLQWSTVSPDLAQSLVGQYHSSRMIPTLLASVAVVLSGILLPYLSTLWEAGRRTAAAQQLNFTYKATGLVATLGSLVILLLSPIFFDVLLQGRYSDGMNVFPMTILLFIWFSLYVVGQDFLWVAEKGKWISFALVISLTVNIGSNILLIPKWGLEGAVLATALANLTLISLILLMNHYSGCPTDKGCWFILATPMLLLLPVPGMISAMCIVAWSAARTDFIFDARERALGWDNLARVRAKLIEKMAPFDQK